MPQISKKQKRKLLAATGVTAGISAVTLTTLIQDAAADTIISATTSGEGSTTTSDNENIPNQSVINLLNSQLRNLQNDSKGVVTISSTPKIVTQDDVEQTQKSIQDLSELVRQYNELKAQIDAQNANNQEINGMSGVDNTENVTGDNLGQTQTNLQDLINQMRQIASDNESIINQNAANAGESNELTDKVKEANKAIASASSNLNHYKDGIVGDLDEVNRKSEDSEAADGIVVDNTETQKANTVKTHASVKSEKTKVSTLDEANQNLERILGNIRNQDKDNVQQALDASTYRANSLANIDDINKWLDSERGKAEAAKTEADAANTSVSAMADYKTQMLAKLNEAKALLQSKGASQKMIDQVQAAIDKVNASNIEVKDLPPVGQSEPVEFGDIGQKQDVENGAQNGTIAKTKDTQSKVMSDGLAASLQAVKDANKKASDNITPTINENTKKIDDYLDKISKGGAGSQIDDTYKNGMSIYTKNDAESIKNFYKQYLDKALEQTNESVAGLQAQISGDKRLVGVSGNPSIAQLSAAMYAENAGTMGDGFGSVMLKDTNINNIIGSQTVGKVSGSTIYADSRTDGGAEAVYNALLKMPGYANQPTGDYSQIAALKDMYAQYLHPAGSSSNKHAENTFTIVTNSPTLRITLPNSFVYTDANGNTGSAGTQVTISATTYEGKQISDELNKALPTESGTYGLFIYNFQIDPYTGQLVAGVSYIAMQGHYNGSGAGGAIDGGNGEMSRSMKVSADSGKRMSLDFDSIGSPVAQSTANGLGLAQTISVVVDPNNKDAVKYAKHAPLYVSDIDDNQQVISYTGSATGKGPKMVYAEGSAQRTSTSDWSNPYNQPGEAIGVTSNNKNSTAATTKQFTNLDDQSVAIYNVAGDNSEIGLTGTRVTVRSKGDASNGYNYMSIDTSIFAPFGIVGSPTLDLDQINDTVNALTYNKPKAKAETKGSYELSSELEYMYTGTYDPKLPKNTSGEFTLPSFIGPTASDLTASSNTSMIVKQTGDTTKKTSSGNSFAIKEFVENNKTSSGNSLVIQSIATSIKTSSGNSLVVKTTSPVAVASGSGNSLTVQNIADAAKFNNDTAQRLMQAQPTVTPNTDGTHTVEMSVYVDPSLLSLAQDALSDWATALEADGVHLNVRFTTDVNELRKGVTLAILESNNGNESVSSLQNPNADTLTMNGLGGIMTKVKHDILEPDGENDVYNASGTVTAGDTLKNSWFTIQLNTEGLKDQSFKNALMGGKLNVNVLKHEIGHVFGLEHDDDDSLMTTYVSDQVFNGKISKNDTSQAKDYLINLFSDYNKN